MVQELSAADAASVSAVGYIHLYHKELDNISLGPQALLGAGEPGTGKDDIVLSGHSPDSLLGELILTILSWKL